MTSLKKLGQKVSEVQARVILAIIYILMAPLALIKKEPKKHNWDNWDLSSESIEDLKRQY